MIYFGTPSTEPIRQAVRDGHIGIIATPVSTRKSQIVEGAPWAADNGCFSNNGFDIDKWWGWLVDNAHRADTCVFATAPDVVGDHQATLKRSLPWLPKIRQIGYKAAFVAQDGATDKTIPWDSFDVLFIGGSTDFKLGSTARHLCKEAKRRGKWIHVGRVNSGRRFQLCATSIESGGMGADSCDGTYLKFGPDINLPKLLSWIHAHRSQLELYAHGATA